MSITVRGGGIGLTTKILEGSTPLTGVLRADIRIRPDEVSTIVLEHDLEAIELEGLEAIHLVMLGSRQAEGPTLVAALRALLAQLETAA